MLFFFFFGGYSDMQFTVRERTQWVAAWIKGTQLCASQIHHRIQQCTDFIIVSFSLQFCSNLCLGRMKFEKCILFPSKGIKYLLKTLKQVPFHTYVVSGFRMLMLKKNRILMLFVLLKKMTQKQASYCKTAFQESAGLSTGKGGCKACISADHSLCVLQRDTWE